MNLKILCTVIMMLVCKMVSCQEGIPVYSDYLSDNLYLIHPAMAGAANANKIRLTSRKQWFGVENAPSLHTLSINFRTGDKSGWGGILFRDDNGRFSQTGLYVTYAHHILFSRDRTDLNMLSFGMSGGFIQSNLDLRGLVDPSDPDPMIVDRKQKDFYYNVDVGLSYHFLEWYAHFTVKNILPTTRDIFNNNTPIQESNNQRKYLFSLGYFLELGNTAWSIEPSMMYQLTDETRENAVDANLKVYRAFDFGTLWGGLSYRRNLDGTEFSQDGATIESQQLQYITPFVGINYKKWMAGYTYSYQNNSVVLNNGGYHQITLGYNFAERKQRWDCNCPAVNVKN